MQYLGHSFIIKRSEFITGGTGEHAPGENMTYNDTRAFLQQVKLSLSERRIILDYGTETFNGFTK